MYIIFFSNYLNSGYCLLSIFKRITLFINFKLKLKIQTFYNVIDKKMFFIQIQKIQCLIREANFPIVKALIMSYHKGNNIYKEWNCVFKSLTWKHCLYTSNAIWKRLVIYFSFELNWIHKIKSFAEMGKEDSCWSTLFPLSLYLTTASWQRALM